MRGCSLRVITVKACSKEHPVSLPFTLLAAVHATLPPFLSHPPFTPLTCCTSKLQRIGKADDLQLTAFQECKRELRTHTLAYLSHPLAYLSHPLGANSRENINRGRKTTRLLLPRIDVLPDGSMVVGFFYFSSRRNF